MAPPEMTAKGKDPKEQIDPANVPCDETLRYANQLKPRNSCGKPKPCTYANHKAYGNEGVYFFNFAGYSHSLLDKARHDSGHTWYQQFHDMVKKNPFAILVACEANEELKGMLEKGNDIPRNYTAQAVEENIPSKNVGPPRPDYKFEVQQGRSSASCEGPDRNMHHKPTVSWRCTLGQPKSQECSYVHRHTNMVAVRAMKCAEWPADGPCKGLGLRPPQCDEHMYVPNTEGA